MIVFLLLTILAVLLLGAGFFFRAGALALKGGATVLVVALIFGAFQGLGAQAWTVIGIVAGAAAVAGVAAVVKIISDADRDTQILKSPEAVALRAQGRTAQETVDALRRGEAP